MKTLAKNFVTQLLASLDANIYNFLNCQKNKRDPLIITNDSETAKLCVQIN